MPPTVQELQAQLAGHLLSLNTAVLFSPSIILSVPPVDFANHPSFSTDIGKPVHKRVRTFTAVWRAYLPPVLTSTYSSGN